MWVVASVVPYRVRSQCGYVMVLRVDMCHRRPRLRPHGERKNANPLPEKRRLQNERVTACDVPLITIG